MPTRKPSKRISTDRQVKLAPEGKHGLGAGLYLVVHRSGARSFTYRYTLDRKASEVGLGSYPATSLAEARRKAEEAKHQQRLGKAPERARKAASDSTVPTFKKAATDYIAANKAGWSNPKHGDQWENTLATYAFPFIGKMPVCDIGIDDVLRVLTPIWTTKTETANRVRGRIERVISFAGVGQPWWSGLNPATWRGVLDTKLPKPSRVAQSGHHPALPYAEIQGFWKHLQDQKSLGWEAVAFAILTACRTKEVAKAQWAEIDWKANTWTIPASRMKAGKAHTVPLSKQAVVLLKAIQERKLSPVWIFPGRSLDKPIAASASLRMVLQRMNTERAIKKLPLYLDPNELGEDGHAKPITVHGFRSTFRDWASEKTGHSESTIEHTLAHTIQDKTKSAYKRGDELAKRSALMQDWADYVSSQKQGAR